MELIQWYAISLLFLYVSGNEAADKPCAAREIPGESVVCVCNSTYCDEIIREQPISNKYISYVTSEQHDRFRKKYGEFYSIYLPGGPSTVTLKLEPNVQYQTIEGFGGAVTDAVGINMKKLSKMAQQNLIISYFGKTGIGYSLTRVPIGGTDFSTHPYTYNMQPTNDINLRNFSLSSEDYDCKIPVYKMIFETIETPLHTVASVWSPPPWMKTDNNITGRSYLKKEHFQTFANYFLRFIEEYNKNGIPIWAITTTNEPMDGVVMYPGLNTLGWTVDDMGNWIENYLGPTIRGSKYDFVKILGNDDQRCFIPVWFEAMADNYPKAKYYLDGIGVHYYLDEFTPVEILDVFTKQNPGKMILYTEASIVRTDPRVPPVVLGSWDRAEKYIRDVIEVLNHNVVGWIDWNLCLDEGGGPNWIQNFVDSPIIVGDEGEFLKQPLFYLIGQISKFVPRGSRRIKVTVESGDIKELDNIAFLTPQQTIVVILYNACLATFLFKKKKKVSKEAEPSQKLCI